MVREFVNTVNPKTCQHEYVAYGSEKIATDTKARHGQRHCKKCGMVEEAQKPEEKKAG